MSGTNILQSKITDIGINFQHMEDTFSLLQDSCSMLNGELNSSCHEFCHEIITSLLQHFLEEIFLCFLFSFFQGALSASFSLFVCIVFWSQPMSYDQLFLRQFYGFQVVINLAIQWIHTAKYV